MALANAAVEAFMPTLNAAAAAIVAVDPFTEIAGNREQMANINAALMEADNRRLVNRMG